MKIRVTQIGGHVGSFAGDCAMIEIESGLEAYAVVIDTGSSVIWDNASAFRNWVKSACGGRSNVSYWLITTHFHGDHFDETKARTIEWEKWIHGNKMEGTPATGTLINGAQHLLKLEEANNWSFTLDAYAPDWSSGSCSDENDLSLAVALYVSNGWTGFSFLSFGDMTPEGEKRLMLSSLFPAGFVKYPHHGSASNYLNYFSLGICKDILISGDSGFAADTTEKLLKDNPKAAIRVLARTQDAQKQFRDSWATRCALRNHLYLANVQLGTGITIEWESGSGFWESKLAVKLWEGKALRMVEEVISSSRRKLSPQWVDAT